MALIGALGRARTTVRLDPEVAAAAEQLRQQRQISLGEAVNVLAKAGLARGEKPTPHEQRTAKVGVKIDVTDVTQALELLDQYDATDTQ